MPYPSITHKIITLDVETTGLRWWDGDVIFGIALSTPDQDYYWDVRETPKVVEWLRKSIGGVAIVANHNIKFDWLMLRKAGIDLPRSKVRDTMIQAALINEDEWAYDLDHLGNKYVGAGKDTDVYQKLADLFGGPATKKAQMPNLHRAPKKLVAEYAKQDTRTTMALFRWQMDEIERQDLHRVVDLESRLLPIVVDMEWGGVGVDVEKAQEAVEIVSKEIVTEQANLDKLAGFPVNPNPSGSIFKIFQPKEQPDGSFVCVDGTVAARTKGGKASLNADFLRRARHPAAGNILNLRQSIRMRDVFLLGHVLGNEVNGVVHPNINQTKGDSEHGTGTGRFSYDSPALQQIPKRNKRVARIVRSVFVPDPDHGWLCADYKQFEFRWFAHWSKAVGLIEAYQRDPDVDFHSLVAGITGLPRNADAAMALGVKGNAKQINLGLTFGMGEGKMAFEMGLPYEVKWDERRQREIYIAGAEAKDLFRKYHNAIPGIKSYLDRASAIAADRGYVITIGGRHIRCGNASWKAGGLLLQGSAADALKQKMIECAEGLAAAPIRLMLCVHDELNFSNYIGNVHGPQAVKEIMEAFGPDDFYKMRVPVRTYPVEADNWWLASKD